MIVAPSQETCLDRLAERLRQAPAPSADLYADIVAAGCIRLPAMKLSGKAARLDRLIGARAWADAAFALIELELPAWTLRRLVHDEGDWLCTLSRHAALPADYDETANAAHAVLPLAILGAFVEARRQTAASGDQTPSAAPQTLSVPSLAACCDNYR